MNRALLSVVLVNLTVALTGTATNNDCDVSVCMKQSTCQKEGKGNLINGQGMSSPGAWPPEA
jgi:hypothetical protein